MIHAVVFVPTSHLLPDTQHCIAYCLTQGYAVVGVIRDDWHQAMQYLFTGAAAVLVIADLRHLDPSRQPRIEVVAEQPTGDGRRHRRTRLIRKPQDPKTEGE